jgi:hypothetical protein
MNDYDRTILKCGLLCGVLYVVLALCDWAAAANC